MASRRLVFKNILNCRDLGGYPSKYGVTKFKRFLRCGVVQRPSDREIEILERFGVKTVIDLRGNYESIETPTDFERINGADVYHISLFEFNVASTDFGKMTLPETYEYIIENSKEQIVNLLETIADAQNGTILFHCFFGKDRTGITSMLLLYIAGVPLEDIVADYQQSYTYLFPYIKAHEDILWNTDSSMHMSLAETMQELIGYINANYGSIGRYIYSTGISEEKIEKICQRFFE